MKRYSEQIKIIPPNGFIPIPEMDFERTVVDLFESIVEKFPDKVAIYDKSSKINYRDYNARSNQCARAILEALGNKSEEPVLFLSDHSITSIVAIMGILKSGNIYVALDVTNPIDRLNAIIEDSQTKLILSSRLNLDLANSLAIPGIQVLNLDEIDPEYSTENPQLRAKSNHLAVIFYTSGSTGKPKGVLIDHRALTERVAAKINSELIYKEDRMLLPFPVGFGWSTQPIFGAFLTGSTLFVRSYAGMASFEQEYLYACIGKFLPPISFLSPRRRESSVSPH
jgi:non-ribosomal peptide synthetase component F